MSEQTEDKRLVKIIDTDKVAEFVQMDDFLSFVNIQPPKNFIKEHPTAKGVVYIPIDKIELLLTKIYQDWYVEVLREGQMLNSIYVAVRLHYKHPITNDWKHQDGLGACPIQTDKGKSAADMAAIKNDAIMKALPAAESYAIKDAAEKLGRLFGKDLNRKDVMGFTPSYGTEDVKEQSENYKLITNIKTVEELDLLEESLTEEDRMFLYNQLATKRRELLHEQNIHTDHA